MLSIGAGTMTSFPATASNDRLLQTQPRVMVYSLLQQGTLLRAFCSVGILTFLARHTHLLPPTSNKDHKRPGGSKAFISGFMLNL
jgi:hypothetical protein